MLKRVSSVLLRVCLSLLLCATSTALAAPAALPINSDELLALGAVFQPQTLRYHIIAPQTQAVLDRIDSGDLKTPTRSQAFFYVQVEIDPLTSRVQPMLVVLTFGTKSLGATAASIGVGDTRYDFTVHAAKDQWGGLEAEVLTAALDASGLSMIRAMLQAQEVSLQLYGQSVTRFDLSWSTPIRRGSGQPDWSDIARASLDGLAPMLEVLDALGMDEYGLYDQNNADWKRQTGQEARVAQYKAQPGEDAMDMRLPGDRGSAVETLQERLAEKNYYYGPISGSFNALTQKAVARAQSLAGLTPTGAADEQLMTWLQASASPVTEVPARIEAPPANGENASFGQPYALGELAILTLDRYWYAQAALPSQSEDPLLGAQVQNTDHTLLILDGALQNQSTRTLDLYWEMPATLVFDDAYAFPCTLYRERDQGVRFDTQLMPLDDCRLVLCAELPSAVVDSDKPLRLELILESAHLIYTLR